MAKPALVVSKGREYQPHVRRVWVTAPLAEKLLERNALNRPLTKGWAEEIARRMLAPGVWKFNNATIGIAHTGDLLDGQHRLWGVILADAQQPGFKVELSFMEGLDPDTFDTIDNGRKRTPADVFAIAGGKHNSIVSSSLRWLYWYETTPRPAHPQSLRISNSELLDYKRAQPDIEDAAGAVGNAKVARRIVPPSILAFVYLVASRAEPGKAGAWLSLLNTGEGLDAKHPVLQLRDRLTVQRGPAKLPPLDVCALTVKSWNLYLTGARRNTLTWRSTEPFPEIATSSGR
jgi:hypothetical protein